MKQGTLFYDRESGRYNFHYTDEDGDRRDYGGIHCGEVFEFKLNDVWIPARMEMGDDRKWYLVGLPGLELDGLEVRRSRKKPILSVRLYYRYNDKDVNWCYSNYS